MAKKTHILFWNIGWDTDGRKVKSLPKSVLVPLSEFDKDFDFSMEGADYLSDKYGYCIFNFKFAKTYKDGKITNKKDL